MSANTKIEWTDHTFNPWIGCTKVSPGCAHCYAEGEDKRRAWTESGWGKGKPRKRTSESYWKQPLKWNNDPSSKGSAVRRTRVFCASLADVFDDEVSIDWLADLLDLIRRTKNLDWQLLTKRPENFEKRVSLATTVFFQRGNNDALTWADLWLHGCAPTNVWIGTSVEDQPRADERVAALRKIPAKIRFLSCEPLLAPVNLELRRPFTPIDLEKDGGGIGWVIVGGESGGGARPCHIEWIASLAAQCKAVDVPVFVKQLGGVAVTENANLHDWPDDVRLHQGKADDYGFAFAYIGLNDRKGGDWTEWPEDLRVREFPRSISAAENNTQGSTR